MNDLLRRDGALQLTLARYRDQPFVWGEDDCAGMFLFHLGAMGHRGIEPPKPYSSALTAKRSLKAMGFETVEQWVDSLLPRIPAARALPGDIILVAGDAGLDAITVSVGYKAFGWHEDAQGATILMHREVKGAWRA